MHINSFKRGEADLADYYWAGVQLLQLKLEEFSKEFYG
jgi:hypothetical protein